MSQRVLVPVSLTRVNCGDNTNVSSGRETLILFYVSVFVIVFGRNELEEAYEKKLGLKIQRDTWDVHPAVLWFILQCWMAGECHSRC